MSGVRKGSIFQNDMHVIFKTLEHYLHYNDYLYSQHSKHSRPENREPFWFWRRLFYSKILQTNHISTSKWLGFDKIATKPGFSDFSFQTGIKSIERMVGEITCANLMKGMYRVYLSLIRGGKRADEGFNLNRRKIVAIPCQKKPSKNCMKFCRVSYQGWSKICWKVVYDIMESLECSEFT